MAVKTVPRKSARERLLAAADQLFYAEGVHVVGVDRIAERAGVTKATLYNTFGSKEDLVRAYLEQHMRRRQERIARILAANESPRKRILGIFAEGEPGLRQAMIFGLNLPNYPEPTVFLLPIRPRSSANRPVQDGPSCVGGRPRS